MGSLRGVEAIYAALSLRGASFNFNPLVRPPERSIDRQGQKFISDLVETPRRENLSELRVAGSELRAAPMPTPQLQSATSALPPAPQHALVRLEPSAAAALTAPLEARLVAVEAAIAHTSRRFSRERLIYAVVISFLVGLTAATALQAIYSPISAGRTSAQTGAAANTTTATTTTQPGAPGTANTATGASATDAAPKADASRAAANTSASQEQAGGRAADSRAGSRASGASKRERSAEARQANAVAKEARKTEGALSPEKAGYVVNVLMEVKDGQVTEARVLNPRPGAGAYEALALRMARQRRYPDKFTGGDTLKVRVKP
jgi:hypothetical protein